MFKKWKRRRWERQRARTPRAPLIEKGSPVPWEPEDEKAWAHFLGTATGQRLRATMMAHEHQTNAESVQAHADLPWKCGYACGMRATHAILLGRAAVPTDVAHAPAPEDLATMGKAALLDHYSP